MIENNAVVACFVGKLIMFFSVRYLCQFMLYNRGVFGSCSNGAEFPNLFLGCLYIGGYFLYSCYVVGLIQCKL